MNEFFSALWSFANDVVTMADLSDKQVRLIQIAIALVAFVSGTGIIGWYLRVRAFGKRAFFDQMVIGVNILQYQEDEWWLLLRTLIEDNIANILDNQVLQRLVERAAQACTEDDPIVRLADPEDHALLITKIQNAIARLFAKEFLLQMTGEQLRPEWVNFVITCERYGGIKATKIRVLVYRRADLMRFIDPEFCDRIKVESPWHRDRIRTLRFLAETIKGSDAMENVIHGRVQIPVAPTEITHRPPQEKTSSSFPVKEQA